MMRYSMNNNIRMYNNVMYIENRKLKILSKYRWTKIRNEIIICITRIKKRKKKTKAKN